MFLTRTRGESGPSCKRTVHVFCIDYMEERRWHPRRRSQCTRTSTASQRSQRAGRPIQPHPRGDQGHRAWRVVHVYRMDCVAWPASAPCGAPTASGPPRPPACRAAGASRRGPTGRASPTAPTIKPQPRGESGPSCWRTVRVCRVDCAAPRRRSPRRGRSILGRPPKPAARRPPARLRPAPDSATALDSERARDPR